MILQAGADNLFTIVQIFRADKADHGVDQQRGEMTRYRIGARFAGLLIDAMMCVGRQTAALPGFEIHHVIAQGAAVKAQRRLLRFRQQRQIDAEP